MFSSFSLEEARSLVLIPDDDGGSEDDDDDDDDDVYGDEKEATLIADNIFAGVNEG
jgi:hypothetical protein